MTLESTFQHIVPEKQRMSDNEFRQISTFITSNYGIKLPDFKKTMVEGRLQKRLRATALNSFKDYIELVFSQEGETELLEMVDAISTNKTDFYRESAHFDFLVNRLLPEYAEKNPRGKMKIWSAAASSGEEIYTIAFVIEEFIAKMTGLKIDYSILGTDISIEKLKAAVNAIYESDRIKDVPVDIRNKYLLRSKDRKSNQVRVIPAIRQKTSFQRQNLMDVNYPISKDFDAIFCRNVLIYFDKENQESVINKLCNHLKVGGYFFLGHSESIIGKSVPLKQIMPTVYRKILNGNAHG